MSHAAITYPSDFPCADRDAYGMVLGMGLLRNSNEYADPHQRRQNPNMNTMLGVMFKVPNAQLFRWQTWVNNNAYHWCNMELAHPYLKPPNLKEEVPVKFVSDSLTFEYTNYNYVTVSAQLELHCSVFAESDF